MGDSALRGILQLCPLPRLPLSGWERSVAALRGCWSSTRSGLRGTPGGPWCSRRRWCANAKKSRDVKLPAGIISTDLKRVTGDPEIKVAALLVGGLEPARTIALSLLESGKDVVTANKALLAAHGEELFQRARELGRSIAFEAAVAGGIPIIANISQCLSANQIESIHAILNGTSNYILTQMEAQGAAYARRRGRGPTPGLRRSRSGDGRRRQRRGPKAGHPRPPGFRRACRLGADPAARHRRPGNDRPAVCQGAGLPRQAAGRGAAHARRAGAARFADAW